MAERMYSERFSQKKRKPTPKITLPAPKKPKPKRIK